MNCGATFVALSSSVELRAFGQATRVLALAAPMVDLKWTVGNATAANGSVLFNLVPQSIHDISLIFHLTHISLAHRS